MLKVGCCVLTLWAGLNLLASGKIIVDTVLKRGHTPAIYLILSESEVNALHPDVLATIDSIAVFANGLNIAFCTVALFLIWRGLVRRRRWSFLALLCGILAAWTAGVAADFIVGNVAIWVSVVSFLFIAIGFFAVAIGWSRAPAMPSGS